MIDDLFLHQLSHVGHGMQLTLRIISCIGAKERIYTPISDPRGNQRIGYTTLVWSQEEDSILLLTTPWLPCSITLSRVILANHLRIERSLNGFGSRCANHYTNDPCFCEERSCLMPSMLRLVFHCLV